jgi:hypothetical protein
MCACAGGGEEEGPEWQDTSERRGGVMGKLHQMKEMVLDRPVQQMIQLVPRITEADRDQVRGRKRAGGWGGQVGGWVGGWVGVKAGARGGGCWVTARS